MGRQCWAREIGGCSGVMSKDHPVSAQLLPQGAIVSGFPWLGGKPKAVGLNSLGVRCLCTHHNSQLSRLDDAAGKLSRELDEFVRVFDVRTRAGRAGKKKWSLHYWEEDGNLLERWCGKFLCTTLAGGLYGPKLPSWTPPVALVEFVFGLRPIPVTAGLFMRGRPGERRTFDVHWGIQPVGDPSNIEGALLTFRPLQLAFLVVAKSREPTQLEVEGALSHLMRHPRAISFPEANLEMRFRWRGE